MTAPRPLASYAARVFGLDVRSLALFRIAIGGLLLVDLAVRSSDFAAMYGADGLAPVEFVRPLVRDGQWSFHLLDGTTAFQAGLFGVAVALAAALMLGYRTRLATIGSWVLLVSLHVRLPVVLNAGDTLLRQLLFWSMFLPLGAVWSLDARRRGPPRYTTFVSAASAALVVQLSLVYWCAGASKLNDSWLQGDALHSIFAYSLYSLPLAAWLRDYPDLTRWLSRSVVWLELLGPLLLYVPWATARFRLIALATFVAFHLGIIATLTVGMFSYVAIAAWLALIPSTVYRDAVSDDDALQPSAACDAAGRRSPLAYYLSSICCLIALGVVVYWNAMQFAPALKPAADSLVVRGVRSLGLYQTWGVFRRPSRLDTWFVYEARLSNGRVVDLRTGQAPRNYERPTVASGNFTNHRWRKLHAQLRNRRFAAYRQPVAEFICRRWNESHSADEQIAQLDLYCYCQRIESTGADGDYVRELLAQVKLGAQGGAFADAVRELDL